MSLAGARGLVLLSRSSCDWFAAMIADRVDEREFYATVTGEKYKGEYGLQRSATQRGLRFEKRLYANNGAKLRLLLSPLCGVAPEQMIVRSFAMAQKADLLQSRKVNLVATRQILADLRSGREIPHLIIQPQLLLPIGSHDVRYIAPDFLLLLEKGRDRQYICGEIKSNIVQENIAAPTDRQRARLQAAVEALALQSEIERLGICTPESNQALFIYAAPFGLSPAPPVIEKLDAEAHEIRRAITRLEQILLRIHKLRDGQSIPLQNLLPNLTPLYVESCPNLCLLADTCKKRTVDLGQALGDNAAAMLGGNADLARLISLLNNEEVAESGTASELEVISHLSTLLAYINPDTECIGEGKHA